MNPIEMNPVEVVETTPLINDFEEFGLSKETFKSIEKLKYAQATPIQKACIPFLLDNSSDIIALAKTGTGKTAAFGIPLVEKIDANEGLQGLVLCPTRELAQQVALNIKNFGDQKGIKVATILGGESYDKQLRALKMNPHVLVSTPGRLIDLLERQIISLEGVKYFILDEADEMLSFGFQDALEQIWKSLHSASEDKENDSEDKPFHTWLFSATMSDSIKRLTKKYLHNPHEVKLNTRAEKINVESYAAVIFEEDKEDALSLLIKNDPEFYGIIFATTKKQVGELEIKLRKLGLDVDSLHGDKVQAERTRTINRMKSKQTKILVATDVAARGLDIQDLTHVVNFEIPWDVETYTHRIGRTARAGKTGIVWTMVKPKESIKLKRFEKALGFEFKNLVIPSVEDVQVNQKINWMKEIIKRPFRESDFLKFEKALSKIEDEKVENLSLETRQWIVRAFQFFGESEELKMKQPRSLELRKSGDYQEREYRGGGNSRYEGRESSGGRRYGSDSRRGSDRSSGGGYSSSRGRPSIGRRRDNESEGNSYSNDRSERGERDHTGFRRSRTEESTGGRWARSEKSSDRPQRSSSSIVKKSSSPFRKKA